MPSIALYFVENPDAKKSLKINSDRIDSDRTELTFRLNEKDKNALIESLAHSDIVPVVEKKNSNFEYQVKLTYNRMQKPQLMPFLFGYLDQHCHFDEIRKLSQIDFSNKEFGTYFLKTHSLEELRLKCLTNVSAFAEICKSLDIEDVLSCLGKHGTAQFNNMVFYFLRPDLTDDFIPIFNSIINIIDKNPKDGVELSSMFNWEAPRVQCEFFELLLARLGFEKSFEFATLCHNGSRAVVTHNVMSHLGNACYKALKIKEANRCYALAKEVDSIVDPTSLRMVLKNSTECMVYGFRECHYQRLYDILDSYNYKSFPFNEVFQHSSFYFSTQVQCKSTIDSLIATNYELALQNKPIIPLLFCISYESKKSNRTFSMIRLLNRHDHSITGSELRHCYRLFSEMPPDIKAIVAQTVKFVHIKHYDKTFTLKEVKPFWTQLNFVKRWESRQKSKSAHSEDKTPLYSWRQLLLQKTYLARERLGFFNQCKHETEMEMDLPKALLK